MFLQKVWGMRNAYNNKHGIIVADVSELATARRGTQGIYAIYGMNGNTYLQYSLPLYSHNTYARLSNRFPGGWPHYNGELHACSTTSPSLHVVCGGRYIRKCVGC